MITPIFIFSLPRSGSTLLQRMLCASDKISTTSEPWILLPLLYTLKPGGAVSEYWHSLTYTAVKDFYQGFPNGRRDYMAEIQNFALKLYEKRTDPGAKYFLDKTPRYHLICREIMELFPEGRFIFLWRNPLAIVASILNTWTNNKWKILYHKIDLYDGLFNLIRCFENHNNKVHWLQYERLIDNPTATLKRLCLFLEIDFDDRMLNGFSKTKLTGWMGDRSGMQKYTKISDASLDNWKATFNNLYRRLWAKSYLNAVGNRNLEIIGYNKDELLEGLGHSKLANLHRAVFDVVYTSINNLIAMSFSKLKLSRYRVWY